MNDNNNNTKWPLIGNEHIREYLLKSINNGRLSSTYVFNGPDNLGKTTAAGFFAQTLLCQDKRTLEPCYDCASCRSFGRDRRYKSRYSESRHSDLHIVKKDKEKKNITIEQVRELIRSLSLSSFLNSYKIGIIKNADSLSLEAANALLKTLEEPRDKVLVVLVTKNIESLPATILSRSQVLEFKPVKADKIYRFLIKEYDARRSRAKLVSRLCLGRPALALRFLEEDDFYDSYSEKISVFLDFIKQDINERIAAIDRIFPAGSQGAKDALMARRIIEIWQGLARDWLLLFFGHNNLVQHEVSTEELAALKNRSNIKKLLALIKRMEDSYSFLAANVSPRLVLENIAINF